MTTSEVLTKIVKHSSEKLKKVLLFLMNPDLTMRYKNFDYYIVHDKELYFFTHAESCVSEAVAIALALGISSMDFKPVGDALNKGRFK